MARTAVAPPVAQAASLGLVPPDPDHLWDVDEVAAFLQVPVATVRWWRENHRGPRGFIVGRLLRFAPGDVLAWVAEQRDA